MLEVGSSTASWILAAVHYSADFWQAGILSSAEAVRDPRCHHVVSADPTPSESESISLLLIAMNVHDTARRSSIIASDCGHVGL